MNLTTWLNQGEGRRAALARACGMAQAFVSRLVAREDASMCSPPGWVPRDRAPQVELFTQGVVTVEEMHVLLQPHERWIRVPDPTYPLPQGRPVVASFLQPSFIYSQEASAPRIAA